MHFDVIRRLKQKRKKKKKETLTFTPRLVALIFFVIFLRFLSYLFLSISSFFGPFIVIFSLSAPYKTNTFIIRYDYKTIKIDQILLYLLSRRLYNSPRFLYLNVSARTDSKFVSWIENVCSLCSDVQSELDPVSSPSSSSPLLSSSDSEFESE